MLMKFAALFTLFAISSALYVPTGQNAQNYQSSDSNYQPPSYVPTPQPSYIPNSQSQQSYIPVPQPSYTLNPQSQPTYSQNIQPHPIYSIAPQPQAQYYFPTSSPYVNFYDQAASQIAQQPLYYQSQIQPAPITLYYVIQPAQQQISYSQVQPISYQSGVLPAY